jgi:hypothetical protein
MSYDLTFNNIISPALKFMDVLIRKQVDFARSLLEDAELIKAMVTRMFSI